MVEIRAAEGTELVRYRKGLWAYTSPRGIRVIVLRLGADPDDTPEAILKARRLYAKEKDWRREMEGDWSSPAGEAFFPIFSEIGRDRYIHMVTNLISGVVYRSFDFGRRHPACTWFQYSPKSDRVWGYREFMPHDLQTHEFRDAVRYLSGQLEWKDLQTRPRRWVDAYAARPSGSHCPPPWFPLGTRFLDIAGKECLQTQSNVVNPEENTAREIFAAEGMYLVVVNPRVKGRNEVVDRMLQIAPDSHPRTFLDPQMEEVIQGFDGAFCYPNPTAAVPYPNEPKDDNYFINLLDAWGYGISAVCPVDTPKPEDKPRVIGYGGRTGREEIYAPTAEEVGWYETRRR